MIEPIKMDMVIDSESFLDTTKQIIHYFDMLCEQHLNAVNQKSEIEPLKFPFDYDLAGQAEMD